MIRVDWQSDGTGRASFAGVRLKIAPEGLRNPRAGFGWYGRRCVCRGGESFRAVEPWHDPREGGRA